MASQEWATEVTAEVDGDTWTFLVVSGHQEFDFGPFDDTATLPELREKGHLRVWQVFTGPADWDNGPRKPPPDDALLDAFLAQAALKPPRWEYDT